MLISDLQLRKLARLYGIQTSYINANGQRIHASDEALMAIIRSLYAPSEQIINISSEIRQKNQEFWTTKIEPVLVVWDNQILNFDLRLPESLLPRYVYGYLTLEGNEKKEITWKTDKNIIANSARIEGIKYISINLCTPFRIPYGYHIFEAEINGQNINTLVISAPLKAFLPASRKNKIWGIFSPLYALHSKNSWGAGDFSDMKLFMEWISRAGANMVGTLPLLPSFFDENFGPGPYMPASRLFWNEFYLDLNQIPELNNCQEAQSIMNSSEFQDQISLLRIRSDINYQQQLGLKRKILEKVSCYFFDEKPRRYSDFQSFNISDKSLEDYASFRATGEKYGLNWHNWSDSKQNGNLDSPDYSLENKQYHLYTQWLAHEQILKLSSIAKQDNMMLYMDFPVGVHPYSYDVWREKKSFAFGINVGAPPDPVFTGGQNWSFPPLHPVAIRKDKYRYLIKCLRHQMKHAGMLRIDHVMNFHRLFWIPEGMDNKYGVYVNYKADEMYAILALESHRNQTIIVGEDLGIVPAKVRSTMNKHGIFRMFVGQYQLIAENKLGRVPYQAVASLNTHDMYPFASFWQEDDIRERQKLNLLTKSSAKLELEKRRKTKDILITNLQHRGLYNLNSQNTEEIFKSIILLLGSSKVFAFLLNLEDLWQETQPQNIPGTQGNQNWSRKARYSIDQFSTSNKIRDILSRLNNLRKGIKFPA